MKRILAVILAATMLLATFSGCGQTSATPQTSGSASPVSSKEDLSKQDFQHLELYATSFGGNTDSLKSVNKAINDYIKPLINADVTIHIINISSYAQQVNLMMSGNEQVDLMMSTGALTSALVNQGALLPVDEQLSKYGQGITSVMDKKVLSKGQYEGKSYLIATNCEQGSDYRYFYRSDINEKLGLGLENAKTWDDIEASLKKMHEKDPKMAGVAGNSTFTMFSSWDWDQVGNSNFGVLMNRGDSLKVENLFETQEFRDIAERMRRWNQAGYIYKEITTSTVSTPELFATGKMLGFFANGNPASDMQESQICGGPIKSIKLVDPFVTSASSGGAGWTIPHNTKNADRAMQFLNLMYSDPKLVNLLTYGIEGQDYVVKDKATGIIDFPQGKNAQNKTYDNTTPWQWGNMLIGYTWNGNPPTLHKDIEDFNKSCAVSKAVGFNFNSSSVQNEITACTNVVSRYMPGITSGQVDPNKALTEFQNELKAAGIDTIIKEKQSQLDKWASENGIK